MGKARTVAEKRLPRPGCELEFQLVKMDALARLQEIADLQLYSIEAFTNPRSPGLFSNALLTGLEDLAQSAIDTAQLLHRLAALTQDKERASILSRPESAPPEPDVGEAEREVRLSLRGLTREESIEAIRAAKRARVAALQARKAIATSPHGCPKCGGGFTRGCGPDGRGRGFGGPHAPARRCHDCATITPNNGTEECDQEASGGDCDDKERGNVIEFPRGGR